MTLTPLAATNNYNYVIRFRLGFEGLSKKKKLLRNIVFATYVLVITVLYTFLSEGAQQNW